MPTTLHRTQVTHTEPVKRALGVAAKQWPGQKDSALLLRLIDEGARAIEARQARQAQERRERVLALAGKYTGVYGPGYLDEVRQGWPR